MLHAQTSAVEETVLEEQLTVSLTQTWPTDFPGHENSNSTDFLVSVVPPALVPRERAPADICCIVDVSGSMGVECTNGDAESAGLSVLDIVKHACKTVAHVLQARDRFSLVAYSTTASIKIAPTAMDEAGLVAVESAIDALQEGGQTNLWDGLYTGLQLLCGDNAAGTAAGDDATTLEGDRVRAVFLLTDGQPNITPPRGHVPMLQRYKEEHGLACTVSTFGFGYDLDSEILTDLAAEGQGIYAFIPDGSFVGTTFVNAVSSTLATCARQVVVKISGLSEAASTAARLPGFRGNDNAVFKDPLGTSSPPGNDGAVVRASWGLQVALGSVLYGQQRDLIVSVPCSLLLTPDTITGSPAAGLPGTLRADVEYCSTMVVMTAPRAAADEDALRGGQTAACCSAELAVRPAPPPPQDEEGGYDFCSSAENGTENGTTSAGIAEALVQGLRLRSLDAVRAMAQQPLKGGAGRLEQSLERSEIFRAEVSAHVAQQVATVRSLHAEEADYSGGGCRGGAGGTGGNNNSAPHARLAGLVKDLEGQVREALSRPDWFRKWGRHYLPSLLAAHSLQQCHNFKDPGVQHYGGELFRITRDDAEETFMALPAPQPIPVDLSAFGVSAAEYQQQVAPPQRNDVDMSTYYNAAGGCFTADATVTMADGFTIKRVAELQPGDRVRAFRREEVSTLPPTTNTTTTTTAAAPTTSTTARRSAVVDGGVARVRFVVETVLSSPALLVTLPGGLQLTAWHPVLVPNNKNRTHDTQEREEEEEEAPHACDGGGGGMRRRKEEGVNNNNNTNNNNNNYEWAFPAEIAAAAGAVVDDISSSSSQQQRLVSAAHAPLSRVPSVFNVALEAEDDDDDDSGGGEGGGRRRRGSGAWHGIWLCGVPTITLGHGIVDDRVASHAYYGTERVLEDCERLPQVGVYNRVVMVVAPAAVATGDDHTGDPSSRRRPAAMLEAVC